MTDYKALYAQWMQVFGNSDRERTITYAKRDFIDSIKDNPGYIEDALRNGVTQAFLITRNESPHKSNIVAMPGEDLDIGDVIECFGNKWLVVEVRENSVLQKSGIMWMCNHTLVFQNHDASVHTYDCVIDSGLFTSTIVGNADVASTDRQYKIYLPYDDTTAQIYVDKRIAIGTRYTALGEVVLDVYKITGQSYVTNNYGSGAHMIIFTCRSDAYNKQTDNMILGICDYIPVTTPPIITQARITGRNTIRVGGSRTYTATFYNAAGEVVDDVEAIWSVSPHDDIVTYQADANTLVLWLSDKWPGQPAIISITLSEASGQYGACTLEVEVEDIGA